MKLLTVKEMKEYEAALFKRGLNADILMENAGRLCAEQILNTYFQEYSERRVSVFCGPGNNGGDGLVLARYLAENRISVVCYIIPPQDGVYKELVLRNLKRAFVCHLSVKEVYAPQDLAGIADKTYVAVDALLGFGASAGHKPEPMFQAAADIINACGNIVSIDGPTGIDMDGGPQYLKNPVRAKETYTLGFAKRGLAGEKAKKYVGNLTVLDIFGEVCAHLK